MTALPEELLTAMAASGGASSASGLRQGDEAAGEGGTRPHRRCQGPAR